MNKISDEVRKTRTYLEGYKENNSGTVEKVKTYDPKRRIWVFEKVKTDERAAKFFEKNKGKREVNKKRREHQIIREI